MSNTHTNPFNPRPDALAASISDLGLPKHLIVGFAERGLTTVRQLVSCSEKDMLEARGFGRKRLNLVKDALRSRGLAFGMVQQHPNDKVGALLDVLLKHIATARTELRKAGFRKVVSAAEAVAEARYPTYKI